MNITLVFAAVLMLCVAYGGLAIISILKPIRPFKRRAEAFKHSLLSVIAFFGVFLIFVVYQSVTDTGHYQPTSTETVAATSDDETDSVMKTSMLDTPPEQQCKVGLDASRDVVGITGSAELHQLPDANSDRIINQKATKVLGKTFYQGVDSSTTVRRLCVESDWTQIQVVTPEWLTHQTGWIPSSAIRLIETDQNGIRRYVESDIHWDKDSKPFKKQIITAVNRIARENSQCDKPLPNLLAKSPSKSKPGAPVFFLTCETNKGQMFNVWFEPDDAYSTLAPFAAIQPLNRTAAVNACEAYAKSAATHPSTVDFSRFMDLAYGTTPGGRAEVNTSFTAKNGFNLEIKYQIRCLYDGPQMIEASIWEI